MDTGHLFGLILLLGFLAFFFYANWSGEKKEREKALADLNEKEEEREKLKKKEIKFNFTTPKKDWSIYGGWVNAYEPINKGRLGSSQEWRVEKSKKQYY